MNGTDEIGAHDALIRLLGRGYTEGGNIPSEVYRRIEANTGFNESKELMLDLAALVILLGLS